MYEVRPKLILGGPGCGKTTSLLKVIEEYLDKGGSPQLIAFVAFTKKAATEAKTRMIEKFNLKSEDVPFFRTLHSFAFTHIDVNRSRILDDIKMRDYAKAEGFNLSDKYIDEFGVEMPTPKTPDEAAFNAIALHRITGRDLDDISADNNLDMANVQYIKNNYDTFRDESRLMDFTDVIEEFVREGALPAFELLIIDEAQDLSHLQWEMVERLMKNSVHTYFAGDDDQAIYAWAGADIDYFLNLDADRHVLPVSYRLKENIFKACQQVIRLNPTRYEKNWKPYAKGGSIDYIRTLDDVDMSEGSWFLLARTNALAQKYTKHLKELGYPYLIFNPGGLTSSVRVDPVRAVLLYENLRKGGECESSEIAIIYRHLDQKFKSKAIDIGENRLYTINDLFPLGISINHTWMDVMTLSSGMEAYIRAIRARGESLIKEPRITVSTIHGVKGGEADNVVIMQQLSSRTYRNWIDRDPQEIRTLFTAMSRARDRLYFLSKSNEISYRIESIIHDCY